MNNNNESLPLIITNNNNNNNRNNNNTNNNIESPPLIITDNNNDSTNINHNHANNNMLCEVDMNLMIATQLFDSYCKSSFLSDVEYFGEMSSILLSALSSLSRPQTNVILPSITSPPPIPSILTSTSTSTPNTTLKSVIASFIELRSQYIGDIDVMNNSNTNNNTKYYSTITNHFSSNDISVFNYRSFHAALLTNSPIIIDAIMPYINYDFTTLNIPHDQIDLIQQMNTIHNDENEIYPTNYILQAIVDATSKGHYQSIHHLINNYQLPPTIPIFDVDHYQVHGYTNLLYYSTHSNSPQLIEYLLPLCIKSTNQQLLSQSILNIVKSGYLYLVKQLHNQYNINLSQLQDDENGQNILHYAVRSNNIELIDYLIEDIGLSVNERAILQHAVLYHKWDNMKHLITKHNADIQLASSNVLNHAADDRNITPDMIDYIITTFNITQNEINDTTSYNSPLKSFAKNCNVIVLKHLIQKYNVHPHCLFRGSRGKGDSLLHAALPDISTINTPQLLEMVKYLICELGLDVNQIGSEHTTPIELLVNMHNNLNESRLPIFKLLLEHKAEIHNMNAFIQSLLHKSHLSTLQHLIETHQPSIHVENIKLAEIPLLHYLIREHTSIEFLTYLLSFNTIDINEPDRYGKTPLRYAIITYNDCNLDIIQLLISNGATVTIDDWLSMFGELSLRFNPYQLFQLLDYFNNSFGFNVETLHGQNSLFRSKTTPLLQFSVNRLNFRYSTIKCKKDHFNMVIIYRTLIHYYKANVNDQDVTNNKNNTVFHNLATYNHYELIQFTLLHSFQKPNVYLINNKGQTFLHILVSKYDQWVIDKRDDWQRKNDQQYILSELDEEQYHLNLIITDDESNDRYDNLEKVLDCVIDLLQYD